MALEEIASTGDTLALAKTNAAIRAAKELQTGLADATSLLAETTALHIEASTRPGEARLLFTSALTGAGKDIDPVDVGISVSSLDGIVLRVAQVGPDPLVVAVRADQPTEAGVTYAARIAVRRFKNTSDPLGDTVQSGIACLNAAKQKVSERIFFEGPVATADGLISRQVTFSRDQEANLTLSETTRYVRPFVRIFGGDGVTDVVTVGAIASAGLPGAKGDIGDVTPAAQAAANEIKTNTGIVEQKTAQAAIDAARSETALNATILAALSKRAAKATTIAAAITAGRSAVADNEAFTATGDDVDYIGLYVRNSASTQTLINTLPTAGRVNNGYTADQVALANQRWDKRFAFLDLTTQTSENLTFAGVFSPLSSRAKLPAGLQIVQTTGSQIFAHSTANKVGKGLTRLRYHAEVAFTAAPTIGLAVQSGAERRFISLASNCWLVYTTSRGGGGILSQALPAWTTGSVIDMD